MPWRSRYGSRKDTRIKMGILLVFLPLLIIGGCYYHNAYKKSAEHITITVADKEVRTHTDEDGGNSKTYKITSHYGEQFTCRGRGWGGGRTLYNSLRVERQYKVLVAGLGVFDRDILEAREVIENLGAPERN